MNIISILMWIAELLFIILFIINRKKRNLIDKKSRKIYKITKVLCWITFIIALPMLISAGITYLVTFVLIIGVPSLIIDTIFGTTSSSGTSSYGSSTTNSNNESTSSNGKKTYCHYNDNKVSTIYENDTVIRSDGEIGYRRGDYIHYNDNTTGRIVMLDDDRGIIEEEK